MYVIHRKFSSTNILPAQTSNEAEQEDDEPEAPEGRFTRRLLRHLVRGFGSKDKVVRYCVLHLFASIISFLPALE